MNSDLVIGTAQFGQKYGIANESGLIEVKQIKRILALAYASGITTLDTAKLYGNCEEKLGEVGITDWDVITKVSSLKVGCLDVMEFVTNETKDSCKKLKKERIAGLLVHRPSDLWGSQGMPLIRAMQNMKDQGLVQKVGISIYDPTDLERVFDLIPIDIVQCPYNILDRRLVESGWLKKLKKYGVEVHVRSIFLQGLLLMEPVKRPKYFEKWAMLFHIFDEWVKRSGYEALDICLSFVRSNQVADKIVVGVDSLKQLEDILDAKEVEGSVLESLPSSLDSQLINPQNWKIQ